MHQRLAQCASGVQVLGHRISGCRSQSLRLQRLVAEHPVSKALIRRGTVEGENTMIKKRPFIITIAIFVCAASFSRADDELKKGADSNLVHSKSVEQLVEKVRQSIAVITFTGRDGKRQGLGTGFVVDADGLIATNLHVIGEARPISVQLADKHYEVKTVHASDRLLDLALIRVNAKNLSALTLGNSDEVKQGQAVVAFGNPLGLTHSVVSGVVSSKREVEGRPMIQLAIPLERGNSGIASWIDRKSTRLNSSHE